MMNQLRSLFTFCEQTSLKTVFKMSIGKFYQMFLKGQIAKLDQMFLKHQKSRQSRFNK